MWRTHKRTTLRLILGWEAACWTPILSENSVLLCSASEILGLFYFLAYPSARKKHDCAVTAVIYLWKRTMIFYKRLSELRDVSLSQCVYCVHQFVRVQTLLSSFGLGCGPWFCVSCWKSCFNLLLPYLPHTLSPSPCQSASVLPLRWTQLLSPLLHLTYLSFSLS